MGFLTVLLSTGVVMSVLMLVLVLIFRANTDILSARTRYMIWIIILVGLLIPFRPQIVSPIFTLGNPLNNQDVIEEGTVDNISNISPETSNTASSQDETLISQDSKSQTDILSLAAKIAVFVWIVGALTVFLRHIIQYRRFYKLLGRWSTPITDEDVINVFKLTKLKLDIENKDIRLVKCKMVNTPMLTGLIKPMVVIPDKEIELMDMRLIIEHELTHYKHKDLYVNLLTILVISLHWFNPILYFCIPAVQGDGELYCDETVLKNKNTNYRRTYGKMIINMIPMTSSRQVVLSTCFYSKKLSVKRRLINIMKNNNYMKKISILSIAGILGVTILSGSLMTFASNKAYIGVEKAKSIALKDANVSNVTFVKAKLDTEDGVKIYDVEFYKGNVEYDYEIDAITGKILEKDRDIENYTIPKKQNANSSTKNNANYIGVEKAKSIALKDANVSNVTFVKAKLDTEDGVVVYDVEFYKGNVEYDYEIDAITGKILEKDRDIENYTIPKKQSTTVNKNTATKTAAQTKNTTNNKSGDIGVEKAKSIALKDANVSNVTFVKAKLDYDDGVKIYDIEFYKGNVEYEYEIDAATGKILEKDVDIDD